MVAKKEVEKRREDVEKSVKEGRNVLEDLGRECVWT